MDRRTFLTATLASASAPLSVAKPVAESLSLPWKIKPRRKMAYWQDFDEDSIDEEAESAPCFATKAEAMAECVKRTLAILDTEPLGYFFSDDEELIDAELAEPSSNLFDLWARLFGTALDRDSCPEWAFPETATVAQRGEILRCTKLLLWRPVKR